MGWSTYFAFIFAAINTLTVTYFLAIENYPFLKEIFPSFVHYIIIIGLVGVPILIGAGYVHFKKSPSFRAESAVSYESNPWALRDLVNSEYNLVLSLKILQMLNKISEKEKSNLFRNNHFLVKKYILSLHCTTRRKCLEKWIF